MLDRTTPPAIRPISKILFPEVETITLGNRMPVHLIRDNTDDVLRVDFMFGSGVWHQPQPLVANLTLEMLQEGTRSLSSEQIAEKLDFYGSWLQLTASYHYSYVTFYSLGKYLPKTLGVLESMLKESTFPEEQFNVQLNKRKQQYLLDLQKVQYLASRKFSECIYGANHPYGKSASEKDFGTINTTLLSDFHRQHIHAGNCRLIVAGNITDNVLAELDNKFGGKDWWKEPMAQQPTFTPTPAQEKNHHITKADGVQSAIRIGRLGITRKHPDYHGLKVLCTVLGGYFGSRLMSSIREEKGYTYGIGAGLAALPEGGSLNISTQTANEYVEPLIKEVFKEMEKLCTETIPAEEMEMARNFMLGDMARSFEGTFSLADGYISLLANGLTPAFYQEQLETVKNISTAELQKLARKYFTPEDFYVVTAGA